eukprot:scaffold672172_cov69-Prasinocladus_malaysianus.AAC.1
MHQARYSPVMRSEAITSRPLSALHLGSREFQCRASGKEMIRFFSFGRSKAKVNQARVVKQELLQLVENTKFGARCSNQKRQQ